ncbi:MAG TPA: DUF5668 domain-containing protein [Candidatus Limnocylindrales bacterium]|nr:DUF5668 domain-containing protein [Candidatus Limnocylindrales bacterium]
MNCAIHTDTPAAAFCRTCGKALCENCKRDVTGAIYCEPCIAARLHGAPAGQPAAAVPVMPVAAAPPATSPSPGVAMLLGFIPGVGAMYNGQFMKAFIHVVIFVMSIVAANRISGAFGVFIAFWIFYMAFDAYKTAEAIRMGLPLPDPLGLDRLFGLHEHQHAGTATATATPPPAAGPAVSAATASGSSAAFVAPAEGAGAPPPQPYQGADNTPVAAIVLIALGALFLLGNMNWFNADRLWPVILIGLGLWIAYKRTIAVKG